jgi:hypothetical protein
MKIIETKGCEIRVSKWIREGEEGVMGVKVSLSDNRTMATAFLSVDEVEKLLVALFREKDEIKKDKR